MLTRELAPITQLSAISIGPMIAHIVEADGIVMTSEMEIVYLAEEILGIKINVDED